jgi:hypothetical protein
MSSLLKLCSLKGRTFSFYRERWGEEILREGKGKYSTLPICERVGGGGG